MRWKHEPGDFEMKEEKNEVRIRNVLNYNNIKRFYTIRICCIQEKIIQILKSYKRKTFFIISIVPMAIQRTRIRQ